MKRFQTRTQAFKTNWDEILSAYQQHHPFYQMDKAQNDFYGCFDSIKAYGDYLLSDDRIQIRFERIEDLIEHLDMIIVNHKNRIFCFFP